MKRIVAMLLALVMMLSLCACGEVPKEMTAETYRQGEKAIEIMDKYLAGSLDAQKAEEKLAAVQTAVAAEKKNINPDPSGPNYVNEFMYDMSIKSVDFSIKNFILGMRGEENSLGKVPDCKETRDFLGSTLYGPEK